MRSLLLCIVLLPALFPLAAYSDDVSEREGWRVIHTELTYEELLRTLRGAVSREGMGAVTDIGPTETAARRGVEIPGNRVIGVFRNDFAVRTLDASVAAMIEAPIRFYVTEASDGNATLSWKTPGHVFAPYIDEGGAQLREIAEELNAIFDRIGARATTN